VVTLVWTTPIQRGFVPARSRWRRRHQAQRPNAHTTNDANNKGGWSTKGFLVLRPLCLAWMTRDYQTYTSDWEVSAQMRISFSVWLS
jgi:hypothetical protein